MSKKKGIVKHDKQILISFDKCRKKAETKTTRSRKCIGGRKRGTER